MWQGKVRPFSHFSGRSLQEEYHLTKQNGVENTTHVSYCQYHYGSGGHRVPLREFSLRASKCSSATSSVGFS